MSNLMQAFLMLASAALIIIADVFIKKVSIAKSTVTFFEPLMLAAYFLYLIQIVIAVYIFRHGGELAIYTNLYIVFYSVLGILAGVLLFSEHISIAQGIGIAFALVGAILLNLR